ncbi:unnamed protein product [Prunus brigantina]
MDLSQGSSQQNDFIGLMNHPQEVEQQVGYGNGLSKKEKILSNYFQSIHPIVGSSFQSPNIDAKHNLGGGGEGSTRAWNSSESKSNTTSPIRNYGSLDSIKPSELILEKDQNVPDATIVSEIDRTMKKHVDSLLHVLEGVSEKLTQLESRTRHLENSVDDLKISVGNNHGNTDGKMRQLKNVLRDVQTGIQVLKDKQAIVEAQLQLGKTWVSNSKVDTQSQVSGQTVASESTQAHQQPPHPVNLPCSLPAVSPMLLPNLCSKVYYLQFRLQISFLRIRCLLSLSETLIFQHLVKLKKPQISNTSYLQVSSHSPLLQQHHINNFKLPLNHSILSHHLSCLNSTLHLHLLIPLNSGLH